MRRLDFRKTTKLKYSGSLVRQLLDLAAITLTLAAPGGTRRFLKEIKSYIAQVPGRPEPNSSRLSQALYYLKKRKLIHLRQQGNMTILELTERGRRKRLGYDFQKMKIKAPAHWDGRWRLLLFDIPESKKAAREALRHKLKRLGFLQFQKSVWIFPYPCQGEIDFLAEFFIIGPYLHLLAVRIENDKPLRAYFKL